MRCLLIIAMALTAAAQPAAQPSRDQIYGEFRQWVTQQPRDAAGDPFDRYRAYLLGKGVSAADADERVRLLREQSKRMEVELWNRVLTAEKPRFNTNPNAFLMEMVKGRKPGKALDVGMGQGRNAIWLAQQGWDVTGFDPAEKAVALAKQNAEKAGVKLTTEIKGWEDFDFGENRWDLVVLSYVGAREFNGIVTKALKPGGVVVLEAFHADATKSGSIGGAVVFDSGELPALFKDLRVVRYEEPMATADFGQQQLRVVRLCAEKP
jgi:2-polyprenyl-3-methyl-5-hydroxy-6-metoxy-1,4-benzoquinol methylase